MSGGAKLAPHVFPNDRVSTAEAIIQLECHHLRSRGALCRGIPQTMTDELKQARLRVSVVESEGVGSAKIGYHALSEAFLDTDCSLDRGRSFDCTHELSFGERREPNQ